MDDPNRRPAEVHDDVRERHRKVHERGRDRGRYWRRGTVSSSGSGVWRFSLSSGARRPDAHRGRRWSSRTLHRLGDLSSHANAGLVAAVAVVAWAVFGWTRSFPEWWETVLYSTASSVTLVMVFAIQHTQARQQAAVQRKLDEVLRATATADNMLIAVEEAPDEELAALADLNIEDRERSNR